jgi:hypothetical protein
LAITERAVDGREGKSCSTPAAIAAACRNASGYPGPDADFGEELGFPERDYEDVRGVDQETATEVWTRRGFQTTASATKRPKMAREAELMS